MLAIATTAHAAFPGANGKIAFETARDGNYEIYSMNPDGTLQMRLTNDPAFDGEELADELPVAVLPHGREQGGRYAQAREAGADVPPEATDCPAEPGHPRQWAVRLSGREVGSHPSDYERAQAFAHLCVSSRAGSASTLRKASA